MQGLPRHRPVSRSKHPSGICYTHADLHLLLAAAAAAAAAAASYKDAVTIDHACACVMRACQCSVRSIAVTVRRRLWTFDAPPDIDRRTRLYVRLNFSMILAVSNFVTDGSVAE